jgi:hypothetical protein
LVVWWWSHQLVGKEAELHGVIFNRGGICGTYSCPAGGNLASQLASADSCPLSPLIISTDNNRALSLASNDSSYGHAKHIDIRYHFIRSHIENGNFNIIHTPGVINTADIFMKSLGHVKFQEHVERLGLGAR